MTLWQSRWCWWVICRIREHMRGTCPFLNNVPGSPNNVPSLFPGDPFWVLLLDPSPKLPPAHHNHWCDSWHISNMWTRHNVKPHFANQCCHICRCETEIVNQQHHNSVVPPSKIHLPALQSAPIFGHRHQLGLKIEQWKPAKGAQVPG